MQNGVNPIELQNSGMAAVDLIELGVVRPRMLDFRLFVR